MKKSNTHYLAWYQNGEGKWVTIEKNLTERGPIAYYKGMYYCVVEETGATEVIHATTGEIMSTIPYPDPRTSDPYFSDDQNYFVESSGDLLLVCQFLGYISNGAALIKFHFEIYRLNQLENGDPVWVKMSNFADRALFLGSSSRGFTVRATDFDRFKGNCVYYSVGALTSVKNSWPILLNYLMRYDIENRCWEEELPCPFHEPVTWIMPSLQ